MSSPTGRLTSERAMQIAERRIPALATKSWHEAYKATLYRNGAVVVKTSRGQIVERRSDGTSTLIKSMPLDKRVKSGLVPRRGK